MRNKPRRESKKKAKRREEQSKARNLDVEENQTGSKVEKEAIRDGHFLQKIRERNDGEEKRRREKER